MTCLLARRSTTNACSPRSLLVRSLVLVGVDVGAAFLPGTEVARCLGFVRAFGVRRKKQIHRQRRGHHNISKFENSRRNIVGSATKTGHAQTRHTHAHTRMHTHAHTCTQTNKFEHSVTLSHHHRFGWLHVRWHNLWPSHHTTTHKATKTNPTRCTTTAMLSQGMV